MRVLLNILTAAMLLTAASLAQAACFRCDPILNIDKAPVTSASGKPLTEDAVKSAIIRSGAALGWQMRDDGPGKLTATLNLRKHTAVVEIAYNTATYSITYKSSVELDEADGKIHKNYNGWIQNLNRGISAQLTAA